MPITQDSLHGPREDQPTQYLLLETTIHSFEKGAASGCRLCTLVFRADSDWVSPSLDSDEQRAKEGKFCLRFLLETRNGTPPSLSIAKGRGPEQKDFRGALTLQMIPLGT